ncbi:hypothetical protein [Streptomyces sp. NPDC008001]|uniref:hypothetical protein n=1 Tax=Streptomyces sp. NPDC008001 TaxID=3364804 RepID=UPI0036E92392
MPETDPWETVNAEVPLLLLPVRVETRSGEGGSVLRVRIYPDDISVDAFDPGLTEDSTAADGSVVPGERTAGMEYWKAVWPHSQDRDRNTDQAQGSGPADPWRALVTRVGPRRAPWVAAALTPVNLGGTSSGSGPEFPDTDPPQRGGTRARLLPDCFLVVVRQGTEVRRQTGNPIPREGLVLGPEKGDLRLAASLADGLGTAGRGSGSGRGAASNRGTGIDAGTGTDTDEDVAALREATAWLTDYEKAWNAGMAVTVTGLKPGERIDRLFVLGVRSSDAPEDTAGHFEELLRAHAYGDGLAFVPPGTATNNTATTRSAWSRPPALPAPPSTEPATAPGAGTNAQVLARALGIDPLLLAGLDGADRTDQEQAKAMATALWPVTWDTLLDRMLTSNAVGGTVPARTRDDVRAHAVAHVRGRGPLPALRVGRQPYGILPVTSHGTSWPPDAEGGAAVGALAELLGRIRPLWQEGARSVPTVTSGDIEKDLPDILGQTPVSRTLRVRFVLTGSPTSPLPYRGIAGSGNITAQEALARATDALLGLPPGSTRGYDLLGQDARNLALPLAHASDPDFCRALLEHAPLQVLEVRSVLQALLALSEARARYEVEQFAAEPATGEGWGLLHEWLIEGARETMQGTLDPGPASELLDNLRNRRWDRLEDCAEQAEIIEEKVQPHDRVRFAARFPFAGLRPNLVEWAAGKSPEARLRTVAAALRAGERFAELRAAIGTLVGVPTEDERALLLAETLDCASHRLDAWLTSLATCRLTGARTANPQGLVIGAYGWLEGIEIDTAPAEKNAEGVPSDITEPVFRAYHDGGHVLAPGPAHAATAAVLRGARLTHDPGDSANAALDIDLSSTRVRQALAVLDGIRAGQPLGALLGYRLERSLHTTSADGKPLDRFIYCLRSLAPLAAAKATDRVAGANPAPAELESTAAAEVVDGVRLLELHRADAATSQPFSQGKIAQRLCEGPRDYDRYLAGTAWAAPTTDELQAVADAIGGLEGLNDAVADLLLTESVHQLVSGNAGRAAAAMDALAGDGPPPEPDVVRTPRSGTALTHRLTALFPGPDKAGEAGGWTTSPRASADPALENWARSVLGDASRVLLHAGGDGARPVTLADAGLSALDFVNATAAVQDGGKDRKPPAIWAVLRRRVPGLAGIAEPWDGDPAQAPAGDHITLRSAWVLARSVRGLLAGCRALLPADLLGPGSTGGAGGKPAAVDGLVDRDELHRRAVNAVAGLRKLTDEDPPRDMAGAVQQADAYASWGLAPAEDPTTLSQDDLTAHLSALREAALHRLGTADAAMKAYDTASADPSLTDAAVAAPLTEAIAAVFGDRLPVLPVLQPRTGDPFVRAVTSDTTATSGTQQTPDGGAIRPWLTRASRVRPSVRRYNEVLLLREALGRCRSPLKVAQLPAAAFSSWIGLPFPQGTRPEEPVTGYVVEGAGSVGQAAKFCGLMFDEWAEIVPRRGPVGTAGTGCSTTEALDVHTAGLALNAPGPSARAPQALLLAMSPGGMPWTPDKVVEILDDTLDLARERAVTLERVPLAGRLLPATYVQDWSLQGEPALDMRRLMDTADRSAVLTHVLEKS